MSENLSQVTHRLATKESIEALITALENASGANSEAVALVQEAIEALPNATQEAAEAANAAAENAIGNFADEFDATLPGGYKKGEYVTYEGKVYRFTSDHTGAWSSSDATVINVGDELTALFGYEANFNFVGVISKTGSAPLNTISANYKCGLYGVRSGTNYVPDDAPEGFTGGCLIVAPAYHGTTDTGYALNRTQKVQILIDPVEKKGWIRYANASNVWRDWFIVDMTMTVTALKNAQTLESGLAESNFSAGGLNENGADTSYAGRIRTGYIRKNDKTTIHYQIPSGYRLNICFYSDSAGTLVGRTAWLEGTGRIGFPVGATHFRMQYAALGDSPALSTSDYDIITIEYGYKLIDSAPYIVSPTKWLAIGDSITYGVCSTANNASTVGTGWANLLASSLGYEIKNMGVRGMGYVTSGGNNETWSDTLDAVEALTEDYNLITIMLGINDYNNSSATIAAISSALETGLDRIIAKFPNARLVVFTPLNAMNRGTAEELYDYLHEFPEANPRTLKDIADGIMDVCDSKGIECHNVSNRFLLNPGNMAGLLLDTVHPSQECHKLLAKCMAHYLLY